MKKTCLYEKHAALGAMIAPFGGFDMPIHYTDIIDEHLAVRQHCGVFDVSHMGEVLITGKDAERYVNHIFTNDVRSIPAGKILYGMMCYENGGVVDDLLVYKMADDRFFLVPVVELDICILEPPLPDIMIHLVNNNSGLTGAFTGTPLRIISFKEVFLSKVIMAPVLVFDKVKTVVSIFL